MHALYTYEDSDEEKIDESVAGTHRVESWRDEMEAPSIPDRDRSCTPSVGSYSYSLRYHAGEIIDPIKENQQYHAPSVYTLPEYWLEDLRRSSNERKRDSRKHTALILLIIVLTFVLGFVVGRFIWITPESTTEVTTIITSSTDAPYGTLPGEQNMPQAPPTQPPYPSPVITSPPTDSASQPNPIPSSPPSTSVGFNLTSPPDSSPISSQLTVGVYYYPWYKDDFHRGDGYVRKQLSPPQEPWLGEYDDSDPATIAKHLQWSRESNIGLWVTSWWGKGSREDITLKTAILKHPELHTHRFAIFYETTGRIKQSEGFTTQRVQPDLSYLCQQYFDHPNYFRLDGKPVLFVYLTRKLEATGTLPNVLELMRQAALNAGCGDIYIVGDHVFQGPPETEDVYPPFTMLDAVTNYDVYGSMGGKGGYIGQDGVTKYYNQQRRWREIAHDHNCRFIPAASPGYNDLGVRPQKAHPPLSRKLSATSPQGSLFETALRQARTLVDEPAQNLLMVNSFNEFHEDTQIEPVIGVSTTLPETLTNGLEYKGYGELYLNILKQETI